MRLLLSSQPHCFLIFALLRFSADSCSVDAWITPDTSVAHYVFHITYDGLCLASDVIVPSLYTDLLAMEQASLGLEGLCTLPYVNGSAPKLHRSKPDDCFPLLWLYVRRVMFC